MNVRFLVVAMALASVGLAACESNSEVAGQAGGGTGGVGAGGSGGEGPGGTGGDPCEPPSMKRLRDDGGPIRRFGAVDGHPERLAGSFPESSSDPVEAARSFLDRIGPDFGVAREGAALGATEGAAKVVVGRVRRGLAGAYVRFEQVHQGLPVFDREVIVHVAPVARGSEIRQVRLGHVRLDTRLEAKAELAPAAAVEAARSSFSGETVVDHPALLGYHVGHAGQRLAFRVLVGRSSPPGSWAVFVDASDGSVLETRDLLRYADGTGLVFDPNPVASTGNTSLYDANDATSAVLDAARVRVVLPRLDGSGYLRGDWVDSRPASESNRVKSPDLVFDFDRSQDGFEETMAYFHIDRVQSRLQALGFTDILNRPQVVLANGSNEENSWFDPRTKQITTGTGGVDDGEDADVLVHEYGHAIQNDQFASFGSAGDTGSLGEGFGDYLAATIAATFTEQLVDLPCLAEWNGTALVRGEPACMRRLDGTKHYPEALYGEVHVDGEIWAAVLWELHQALGADVMDRLVIESHFTYSMAEKFTGAAEALLEVDRSLYGGRHLDTLIPILVDRGLLRTPVAPALFPDVLEARAIDVQPPRSNSKYRNRADNRQEIRVPGAAGLRLHFTRVDTELHESCVNRACDNIYLTNDQGYLFQILNGQKDDVTSVVIPGEAVHVRLVSDGSEGGFGYQVDRVDVMGYRTCGNGALDGAERCDGANLGGATCQTLGFAEGTLSCGLDCRFDVSACIPDEDCGDGEVGTEEECDGPALQGATCRSLGFGGGVLSCSGACRLDTSTCNSCGDGVRDGTEACDGQDVGGLSCGDLGQGQGPVACSPACTLDLAACVPNQCS